MNKKPLITIIIPVYNNSKYIRQCINSILNQDYKKIEIIVIDDGSTDDSLSVSKELSEKDARIHVYSQKNSGVSSARNMGIKKATGDYVFFVDSDDILSRNCISYCLEILNDCNAEIAVIPVPNKFIGDGEAFTGHVDTSSSEPRTLTGREAALEMLYYKIVISSWGKLFSKKLIDDNGIAFDENLAYGEGFYFSIECLLKANSVAIGDRKVYNYRLDNPSSAMTKYKRRLVDDSLKSQDKIRQLINPSDTELIKASDYAIWHTYCDCYNTIIGARVDEKQLRARIRRQLRKKSFKNIILPIPAKDKVKSICFGLSPTVTSAIINTVRKRTFTK